MYTKFLIFLSLVILTIPINKATIINYDSYSKFNGHKNSVLFKYCGEVGLYTFSISSKPGFRSDVNLFYPRNIDIINFEGTKIKILKVTPHELKIDVLNHRFLK